MISFTVSGNTNKTDAFLEKMMKGDFYANIDALAQRGVEALRAATPRKTGLTADSWEVEVIHEGGGVTIWWNNTNTINGFNVAIGLEYGHGTGTGGYVVGREYINGALKPIFDEIADGVWKEVTQA